MKKVVLLMAATVFMGCSSHEDNDDNESSTMIGKWRLNKTTVYKSSTKENATHTPTGCSWEDTHEFRQDDMTTVNYTPKDNTCVPYEHVIRKYTYNAVTKKFWYEGEKDYPYDVSQLNPENMILESNLDIDNDGVRDVVRYYFERIHS